MRYSSAHGRTVAPLSFEQVYEAEIACIARQRDLVAETGELCLSNPLTADEQTVSDAASKPDEVRNSLVGLAFSGGGIRSATFNLGVLQGLAEQDVLRHVDYLSTVSGGGYVGGWLQALIRNRDQKRPGGFGATQLRELLSAGSRETGAPVPETRSEPPELGFLRDHSNYLTPKLGVFTSDTWTVAVIYVRNLLLNLAVLLPFLTGLMIFVRGALLLSQMFTAASAKRLGRRMTDAVTYATAIDADATAYCVYTLTIVCMIVSVAAALWLLTRDGRLETRKVVYSLVVLPVLFASWLLSTFALDVAWYEPMWPWLGATCVAFGLCWSFAWAMIRARDVHPLESGIAAMFGCALAIGLLWAVAKLMPTIGRWALPLGMPVVLIVLGLAFGFQVGFLGQRLSEHKREWGSRLVALLWVGGAISGAVFSIASFGHVLVGVPRMRALTLVLWSAMTIGGVKAGSVEKASSRALIRLLARAAPYVFVLGLLILISSAAEWVIQLSELAISRHPLRTIPAGAGGLLVSWLLSERVGINDFSIHALYRNRLVRCYLGGARAPERAGDDFVGFDRRDDELRLDESRGGCPGRIVRPFHIINASLNLVSGERLAWQFRRARSFVFTPLYSGFEAAADTSGRGGDAAAKGDQPAGGLWRDGYRPSRDYGGGISRGTAMAISGAAVAPNMGARSSPALAFLMTVFNARLGWWLGNPRHADTWKQAGPRFGLVSLLLELLGSVSDRRRYVYLSDGAHFENLGIYELVRRRCRYVIVSDVGADPELAFADLAAAIMKCRSDFGVEIEIDLCCLKRDPGSGQQASPCAVGRIRYDANRPELDGIFVYMKAALTGREPADVLGYARSRPAFPHESTADQWFDEAQFESYRVLGQHIARETFGQFGSDAALDLEGAFVRLHRQWTPRSAYHERAFAKHSLELNRLNDLMRRTPELAFLDYQFFPEWETLRAYGAPRTDGLLSATPRPHAAQDAAPSTWLPHTEAEVRAGFYHCQQLVQIMENVYIDLRLEQTFDHPDNQGWINLFRHWSWSSMFRITWTIVGPTTGARFRTFAALRLGLGDGDTMDGRTDLAGTPPQPEIELRWTSRDEYESRPGGGSDIGLSALERELLERVLAVPTREDRGTEMRIFSASIKVCEPFRDHDVPRRTVAFPIAFGVVHGEQLVYLRIRDHLRRAGHARRILHVLLLEVPALRAIARVDKTLARGLADRVSAARLRRLLASVRRQLRRSAGRARLRTTGQLSASVSARPALIGPPYDGQARDAATPLASGVKGQ